MARYLTHMDSPDKAQYDPEGVCEFGGADWRDLCATCLLYTSRCV